MKVIRVIQIFSMAMLIFFAPACSGSSRSPVTPIQPDIPSDTLPQLDLTETVSSRSIIGLYIASIDPRNNSFTITPFDRNTSYHYPLTQIYPDVVKVTRYGFTPNLWADITINHPLPGSGLDAFDPRVIAILPANDGVSMNYPAMHVLANNSVVKNPDGYTMLWDDPSIPGTANPFIAYYTENPYRVWSSTINPSQTKRWEMDIDGFGGPLEFLLAVDVSIGYPNLPQGIVDNAPEPVEISILVGDGLNTGGGSAQIEVTLMDWQGSSEIRCYVESPELFDGAASLNFFQNGPGIYQCIFKGMIHNQHHVSEGDYDLLVAALDMSTNSCIFKEGKASVTQDIVFNPTVGIPKWLNIHPNEIRIEGNYAYIAGDQIDGLTIFDISDPNNPEWINNVTLGREFNALDIKDGYVYTLNHACGLYVLSVDPPHLAHPVGSSGKSNWTDISIVSNYAFITGLNSVDVVDISVPQSPNLVKSVSIKGQGNYLDIENGFAYVISKRTGYETYFSILDVSIPGNSYVIRETWLSEDTLGIDVSGNFAYILTDQRFLIADVSNPGYPRMIRDIAMENYKGDVAILGDFAYIASDEDLLVVDVDPPETAEIIQTVNTLPFASSVALADGYAFVSSHNGKAWIQIVDISDPGSANISGAIHTLAHSFDIDYQDGYAYIGSDTGFYIVDVDPPESSHIIKFINSDHPGFISVSGSYAYFIKTSGSSRIFCVADIDPPQSAEIIREIPVGQDIYGVRIVGNSAYVSDGYEIDVIDIDPPENSEITDTITLSPEPDGFTIKDGYLYYLNNNSLYVADIDPIADAHVVASVDLEYDFSWPFACWDLDIEIFGSDAYVTSYCGYTIHDVYVDAGNIHRIDISVPESAHETFYGETEIANAGSIMFSYPYIYLSSGYIEIINLDSLSFQMVINTGVGVYHSAVSDRYIYSASHNGGLVITRLW